MFIPNLVGKIYSLKGYDIYARAEFDLPRVCPFAVVNLEIGAEKTSVRTDSSASRGSADEMTAQRAKILIVSYITCAVNDRFEFEGINYKIVSKFTRRSVDGLIDHFECDLEVIPT